MQFERLMTEKILSNQKGKDEHIGIRIKMNNNIIEEHAIEDKFVLLHTIQVKQKNKPINILIDCGSTHTIINSKLTKQLGAKIISKTEIIIETQNGEEVWDSYKVNVNLPGLSKPIIAYSIKADLVSLEPDIKTVENWPTLDETMRNEVLQNLYVGSTDIVIGQDNFWNFEPSGFKQSYDKKYGFIKTRFGWSLCGDISTIAFAGFHKKDSGWPQNFNKNHVVRMKNNNQKVSEITLQETLQNLFNRDEEIKTETDLTLSLIHI